MDKVFEHLNPIEQETAKDVLSIFEKHGVKIENKSAFEAVAEIAQKLFEDKRELSLKGQRLY